MLLVFRFGMFWYVLVTYFIRFSTRNTWENNTAPLWEFKMRESRILFLKVSTCYACHAGYIHHIIHVLFYAVLS